MEEELKKIIWKQFGGSMDMLENSIASCPEQLWNTNEQFWYRAYHTLFFLDYYLTIEPDTFVPPAPFTLSEFDPNGKMPDQIYSKEELLNYLIYCRKKCHDLISGLTPETELKRWVNSYRDYSMTEILIYNMRHVQHHLAQLNMLLRQGKAVVPKWISQTKMEL